MQARGANASARATAHARDGKSKGLRSWAMARDGGGSPSYWLVGPLGPANSLLRNRFSAAMELLNIVLTVSAILSTALLQLTLQSNSISDSRTLRSEEENLLIVFVVVGR